MKTVYDKIERLRTERKVGKNELVEGLDITRQGFDNMMKNDTMTLRMLGKIAAFFGINAKYFFEDDVPPPPASDPAPLHEIIKVQRETIETQKMLIEELKKNR